MAAAGTARATAQRGARPSTAANGDTISTARRAPPPPTGDDRV
jgi:hypothetical protein